MSDVSDRLPEPFYVYRDEDRTRIEGTEDLLGWGARFPSGACYVDWRLEAFDPDDRLQYPHVSRYGSIVDVEQGTGGVVVWPGPDGEPEPLTTLYVDSTEPDPTRTGDPTLRCDRCGAYLINAAGQLVQGGLQSDADGRNFCLEPCAVLEGLREGRA